MKGKIIKSDLYRGDKALLGEIAKAEQLKNRILNEVCKKIENISPMHQTPCNSRLGWAHKRKNEGSNCKTLKALKMAFA